jgi:hypothetical protein
MTDSSGHNYPQQQQYGSLDQQPWADPQQQQQQQPPQQQHYGYAPPHQQQQSQPRHAYPQPGHAPQDYRPQGYQQQNYQQQGYPQQGYQQPAHQQLPAYQPGSQFNRRAAVPVLRELPREEGHLPGPPRHHHRDAVP